MFLCWFEFEGEYLKSKLLDREEGSEEEVKLLWERSVPCYMDF